jgi:hypothetical protein
MRIFLSQAAVLAIPLPAKGSKLITDRAGRGASGVLVARIYANGKRSYGFRYEFGGTPRWMAIGDVASTPDADLRAIAAELTARVKGGGDPANAGGKHLGTLALELPKNFGELAELFIQAKEPLPVPDLVDTRRWRPGTARTQKRNLRILAKPLHAHLLRGPRKIERPTVALLLDKVVADCEAAGHTRSKAQALRDTLHSCFEWAIARGYYGDEYNPVARTSVSYVTKSRDLTLNRREMQTIYEALPPTNQLRIEELPFEYADSASGYLEWTDEQVAELRRLCTETNYSFTEIGRRFGISCKAAEHKARRLSLVSGNTGRRKYATAGGPEGWGPIHFGNITRLLMRHPSRRSEISNLQWCEINFSKLPTTLTLYNPKGIDAEHPRGTPEFREVGPECILIPKWRSKTRTEYEIPLTAADLALFEQMPRVPGTPFVFGSARESRTGFLNFPRHKDLLDEKILGKVRDWTHHTFRHTLISIMKDDEFRVLHAIVDECASHKGEHKKGAKGGYDHSKYREQKREALAKLGRWLYDDNEAAELAAIEARQAAAAADAGYDVITLATRRKLASS